MKDGNIHKFDTGAVRIEDDTDLSHPELISTIGLERLAITYGLGAKNYGKDNWRKGIPWDNIMRHLELHILYWKQGDRSEDHLAHAAWGLFTLMTYEITHPELDNVTNKVTDIFTSEYPESIG